MAVMKLVPFFIFISFITSSLSWGDAREFSNYQKIGTNSLVVIHASTYFNRARFGEDQINKLIGEFKHNGDEVYYLYSDRGPLKGLDGWYVEDKNPTQIIRSYQGENNLLTKDGKVTIAGGFLGSDEGLGCMTGAITELVLNHFENYDNSLEINISIGSSYTYGFLGWDKTLSGMFHQDEKYKFLAFLLTAQPGEVNFKDKPIFPVNMESILDPNDEYRGYRDFWNVFRKTGRYGWGLAGIGSKRDKREIFIPGTVNGFSYEVQFNGRSIGYLGKSNKKIVLNFM